MQAQIKSVRKTFIDPLRSQDCIQGHPAVCPCWHAYPANCTPLLSVTEVRKFYIRRFGSTSHFKSPYLVFKVRFRALQTDTPKMCRCLSGIGNVVT